MARDSEQGLTGFYLYPSVGKDDWRYIYATAQVRVFETQMLSRSLLINMATTESYEGAFDMLSNSPYSMSGQEASDFSQVERMLLSKRTETRELFAELMLDAEYVEIFKLRSDFENLRLAIRRSVTGKAIGVDYSNEGNVPAELFERVFEQEDYSKLAMFAREAVEQAVLAYYEQKDIRRIDQAIDEFQARYMLEKARELKSEFLESLFRVQIDLTNIRTMLRLKFTDADRHDVFIEGGFIDVGIFRKALNVGYEAIGAMFFASPYQEIVEGGCHYLAANKSFLKLEQLCQEYIADFLKSTSQITAGPQPVIAYLLRKESEIRTVRLILTAKKNGLDNRLILDRIGDRQ